MGSPEKKIWFPAKRYGWGWGLPLCWQGWAVMGIWFALLVAGIIPLATHPIPYIAYIVFMSLVLTIVCYLKGEKPRWRWGKN